MNPFSLTGSSGLAKGLSGCIFLSLFLIFTAGPVYAHRVWIYAWVEGDTVHTESRFSSRKGVKNGKITVYDLTGKRFLEGLTDTQGKFSFKTPKETALRIVLEAGMGHRAEWTIPLNEVKEAAGNIFYPVTHPESHEVKPEPPTAPISSPHITREEVRLAMEKAMDKKLAPVIRMLYESREPDPSVKDILGGIGYILGLIGIASYFHYRRRKGDQAGQ